MSSFALLRVAALSVDEISTVARDDPFVAQAVGLAAGSDLLRLAKRHDRAARAIERYIRRMGGRATPFGLFAGTTVVPVGREAPLALAGRPEHQVRVRVDFGVLERVVAEALGEGGCPLRVNPTLRRVGKEFRYMTTDLRTRSMPASGELETLASRHGRAMSEAELLAAFSLECLRDLVRRGVLVRSIDLLEPGREPTDVAADLLQGCDRAADSTALRELEAPALHRLDDTLPDRLTAKWERAAETLPALKAVPEAERHHIDLELSLTRGAIASRLVTALDDALRRIERLFPDADPLDGFRARFQERYEDSEVSLPEVADFSTGIMSEMVPMRSPIANAMGVTGPADDSRALVDRIAIQALESWMKTGRAFDLGGLPACTERASRSVQAALLDNHESRFDALLLCGQRGAPMSRLARFGLSRSRLTDAMRRWTAEHRVGGEEAIAVELVHSPGGRQGNVLIRPKLNAESLALTGGSGGTISLERMTIRLIDGQFALRDSLTGRPIVLEVNSAHQAALFGDDPIYRLLAQLGDGEPVRWRWGTLVELPHLPRITCGNVIVHPERWRVTTAQLGRGGLGELLPGIGDRRWVGYGEPHRQVPVELADRDAAADVEARIAKYGYLDLFEMPQLESPAVAGPTGRHVAEIYVPLPNARKIRPAGDPSPYDPKRGRDWIYFKYYCGVLESDEVIIRAHALARRLYDADVISKWFFIRYPEGGNHVRVRMRPASRESRTAVIAALDDLGANGPVTRVTMDTYVPEVARYGGPDLLPHAEALFAADSAHVAHFLEEKPAHMVRLFQAVAGIVSWSAEVWPTYEERLTFLRWRQKRSPYTFDRTDNRQGRFYRRQKARLDAFLERHEPDPAVISCLRMLRIQRNEMLRSVLHMHMNRLFVADPVRLESVAYELAIRKTLELRARASASTPP